jgi:serine/threonine protein kinase
VDLAGKYRLIAELGQGGMATVYLAVALGSSGFKKLAVVKLIRPQYASDPDLIQMFLDEARLCARLSHPNIVQTYDVGVDAGQYLMAMEYLDGVSLYTAVSRFVKTGTPFPFPLRARILSEVLEGLRYAHELRDYDGKKLDIVHRDVTPHNIFITYDGQVKLLDFGIAKATTSSVQTATGVIKGKLTYMAPEQAMCETIDARADLYAVGVMLWEAVTGRRRWPAGLSDAAVFTRVASGEMPEAPDAASRGFPVELDAIVLKSLSPKPEDRFQTAAEMRGALDAVLDTMEEPSSLRDLGRLLATTFAEDRKRIRQVIETQFRAMESGRPTNPSVNLPTVHPPRGTDSAFRERLSKAEVTADKDDAISRAEGSSKTGLTGVTGVVTRTADARPRASLRSRTVIAVLGLVSAAAVGALAVVGSRVFAHPTIVAVDGHAATQPVGAQPSLANGEPEPSTTPQGRAAEPPAPPPSASSPSTPGETAGRSDGARALPAASPATTHHQGVHPALVAHAAGGGAEPPGVDASASPPTAASTDDAVNVFRTPVKPKVSLERDNPWP